MKYDLVKEDKGNYLRITKFHEKVNEKIKKGWMPQGGICYARTTKEAWLIQAMIKE